MGRYDAFKKAVELTIIGDPVTLKSVTCEDGTEFHITPRKFSKESAARINKIQGSIQEIPSALVGKIRKLRKEHGTEKLEGEVLEKELSDEELMMLVESQDPVKAREYEREKLLRGIAHQDLTEEPGPMTEELADLILDSPAVSEEVLAAVNALNPTSVPKLQDSSGT